MKDCFALIAMSVLLSLSPNVVVAQTKPLVELTYDKGKKVQGRVQSFDKRVVTLMQRDGQIKLVQRGKLKSLKTIAKKFRAFSAEEMRAQLREELGDGFAVNKTQHYVVCAPKGAGKRYNGLLENTYSSFHYQFRRRSIPLKRPEFPLVAIVFPSFQEFARYAAKDGLRATPGLRGYYHRLTNRLAVYESKKNAKGGDELPIRLGSLPEHIYAEGGRGSTLESTIIHETMHQVGFNTEVHPRLGQVPTWIVEGIAMTFESPGFISRSKSARDASRINRDRYVWFRAYMGRRKKKSLRAFIESDALFRTGVLDAYSQAWALTFYFMDQPARSYKFRQYLKAVNKRDLTRYSKADRLKDFESVFGDIDRVDTAMLRHMQSLETGGVASR